jgi:S1-C subfamily serine protease
VIVRLDGVGVTGVDDLIRLLDRDRIGRPLRVDALRRGGLRSFDILATERSSASRAPAAPQS